MRDEVKQQGVPRSDITCTKDRAVDVVPRAVRVLLARARRGRERAARRLSRGVEKRGDGRFGGSSGRREGGEVRVERLRLSGCNQVRVSRASRRTRNGQTHELYLGHNPFCLGLGLERVKRPRARDRTPERRVRKRVLRALSALVLRVFGARAVRAPVLVPLDQLGELRGAPCVLDEAVLQELLGRGALRRSSRELLLYILGDLRVQRSPPWGP